MKKINVTIVGVGLIGGSLGMALRACRKRRYHVTGIGRNARRLAKARRLGAADAVTTDIAAGVQDADIVVIGTPVNVIAGMVKKVAPLLKPGAVITDVGSAKAGIERDVLRHLRTKRTRTISFIGAHPMAGRERSGVEHASKDLLRGASVAVIPPLHRGNGAFRRITAMWKDAGAAPLTMTALAHDTAVAVVSHLPHIIAFTLSRQAAETQQSVTGTMALAAGSFRDVTRVADADPRDWAAICHANRHAIRSRLAAHIRSLEKISAALDDPRSLERDFRKGNLARTKLFSKRNG